MKVNYKKTITEKIIDVTCEAELKNKEIESVSLTLKERSELVRHINTYLQTRPRITVDSIIGTMYLGVIIKAEEERDR